MFTADRCASGRICYSIVFWVLVGVFLGSSVYAFSDVMCGSTVVHVFRCHPCGEVTEAARIYDFAFPLSLVTYDKRFSRGGALGRGSTTQLFPYNWLLIISVLGALV